MKTSILATAIAACVLSTSIVSAEEKAAPAKPAMNMKAGMDMDKQMSQMRENMKKMQLQMDKIRATTDPKERQKLMQEHMQTMQENMKAMRAMGGPMMDGGGHAGMKMGANKGAMPEGDMMKHHHMMEKRMDMMQMMMEQMMQRDQAMGAMPAK
jgi:hypothetical protein